MEPWHIIGWIVLGLIGAFLLQSLVVLVALLAITIGVRWRAFRDRRIAPATGQVWLQDGKQNLYITNIYENGIIGISTAPAGSTATRTSWGESPSEFEQRKRQRQLILLYP